MTVRFKALGVDVNVLLLGKLTQGSGDCSTAFRIRQYFDHGNRQSWIARNVNSFEDENEGYKTNFLRFLYQNNIQCVVAINAFTTCGLMKYCPLPYALVLSGSELNEHTKNKEELEAMTMNVRNASYVIAYTEVSFGKGMKLWPELKNGKFMFIQRGVITRPAPKYSTTLMEKYQLGSDAVVFIMICRLHRSKDPLQLVPAFTHWHQLHEKHPFLVIVGSKCDPDYFKEFSDIIDGCPGVVYIGQRTMRETHRLLADSFALINSSSTGGTCTSILEAMDLGIPVIARNIPAHSTIIEDGNTGLLYNWPEDFIARAEMLLDNELVRENVVTNAKLYVSQRHSCQKENDEYADLATKLKKLYSPFIYREPHEEEQSSEETDGSDPDETGERKVRFQLSQKSAGMKDNNDELSVELESSVWQYTENRPKKKKKSRKCKMGDGYESDREKGSKRSGKSKHSAKSSSNNISDDLRSPSGVKTPTTTPNSTPKTHRRQKEKK